MNDVMMDNRGVVNFLALNVLEEAAKRFLKAPEIFMRPIPSPLGIWHQAAVPEESKHFAYNANGFSDKGITRITALGLCYRIVGGSGRDSKFYQIDIADRFARAQQKVIGYPALALYGKEKSSKAEDVSLRTRLFMTIISKGMEHVDLETAIRILKWKEE